MDSVPHSALCCHEADIKMEYEYLIYTIKYILYSYLFLVGDIEKLNLTDEFTYLQILK